MQIRRADIKDADKINELLFQVAKIHANGRPDIFKTATKKYSDQELIEIINNDDSPIFVATDEKDFCLGYAFCVFQKTKDSILLQDRKTLYIDDICVDENSRGKHIGKSLYDFIENFAKENGFDNITLNVWSFNESAYKFYEKCGMTPLKTTMEKRLK
ncbi:MAG: GNAT family N-acetyltransferase [Acutalibacteraceae bacterium]|nr:GNAT family N-acetyltransferase [Acutalibacteraceae bacterium]